MTSTEDQAIHSALASIVADAPEPMGFDQLTTHTATSPTPRRRWSPVLAMAAGFLGVIAIGAVALVAMQSGDPAADGGATIYVEATVVPDDLVLRVSEVWDDGMATTQIYVEAAAEHYSEGIRTASISVDDYAARIDTLEGLTEDQAATATDSRAFFAGLKSTLEAEDGWDTLTFTETYIRDRHSLVIERSTTTNNGEPITVVGIIVAEGDGHYTEINTHRLSRAEAEAIAEGLRPTSPDRFPSLTWP